MKPDNSLSAQNFMARFWMRHNKKTGWLNRSGERIIRKRRWRRKCGFGSAISLLVAFLSLAIAARAGIFDGGNLNIENIPSPAESAGGRQAAKLDRGKFLVAARQLGDPNFRKAVVLLVRYGPGGAMGLVINRPIAVKLSAILPNIKELAQSSESLYLGGPVQPAAILLLVKTVKPPESATPVVDDIYLTSSTETLRQLIKKADKSERFRIFAGYAGWAPKQLESECERGDWFVIDADHKTLFDRNSSEIWPELIQRVTVKWVYFNSEEHADWSTLKNSVSLE
jgi:putative transcriptional regulator